MSVGNESRGDDGAGILFGALVRDDMRWSVIEGGGAPENMTSLIRACEPEAVLIADAMDFGGAPGEVMLAQGGELAGSGISTHGPLILFTDYIERSIGARVYVLGFQPERTGFGESMSSVVKGSVARMSEMLMESRGIEDFFHEVQLILQEAGKR